MKRVAARPRRNASAVGARAPARPRASAQAEDTPLQLLGASLIGAAGSSFGGSLAARYGFHPGAVALALTAVGGLAAWKSDSRMKQAIGSGVAAAGGSQLLLMRLASVRPVGAGESNGRIAPPPEKQLPAAAPTLALAAPPLRQAAALRPGQLDSAFERARTELADEDERGPGDDDDNGEREWWEDENGDVLTCEREPVPSAQ
ncbi:MAG TPA: hypothetical protein VGM88_11700 [Kofleriaceae bacterium]|jgi:hypothetical protein